MEASFNVWVARQRKDEGGRRNDEERHSASSSGILPPSTFGLAGFWAAFVLARVLTAALVAVGILSPVWGGWGLVLLAVLVLVALGNLAGSTARASTSLGILAVGLLLGPIFPALLGVAFRRFEDERGTTFALLFAVGSVGSLLWSRFIPTGENRPQTAMPWGALALTLGLVLASLVYVLLG
jgi:hypothetical protein